MHAGLTQKQLSEIPDIDEQDYGQAKRGAKKRVVFCAYFHIALDGIIKINAETEGHSLKLTYIMEISHLLEDCFSDPFMLIKLLVKNIDLLKRG